MIQAVLPLLLMAENPVADIPKPPTATPPGVVVVWGTPAMEKVAKRWAEDFEQSHPDIRVELKLTGSDVGMAALYAGVADIVLMGRKPTSSEVKAFEWIFRYQPNLVPLAKGSLATPGQSPDVAILVSPSNPIHNLTAADLARVLLEPDLTWGDLGVEGPQSQRPVRVYMPHSESGTGRFIRETLVDGDIRLDWSRITEFSDAGKTGQMDTAAVRASLSVQGDIDGIAFGLAALDGTRQLETPFEVTLSRHAFAAINIPPGGCVDSEVSLFLSMALSKVGSAAMESVSDLRSLRDPKSTTHPFCV